MRGGPAQVAHGGSKVKGVGYGSMPAGEGRAGRANLAGCRAAAPVPPQSLSPAEGGGCSGATPIWMARIRRRSPRVVAVWGGGVEGVVVVVSSSRCGELYTKSGSGGVKVGLEDEV